MKTQTRNSHSRQLGMAVPDIVRGHLKVEFNTASRTIERLSAKSQSNLGITAPSKGACVL